MHISILKASLAIAAYCQVVLGQALSIGEVTGLVNQLNTQGLDQISTIALFNESSREEYLQRQPGPLTTYSQVLYKMYDSLYGIRRRTQGATPGGVAEQKELASAYLDMAGTHTQMLDAFVDKATALWAEEEPLVPAQIGVRLFNYRSSCKNLGNALQNYAPNNASELLDTAVALDNEFAKMEAALTQD